MWELQQNYRCQKSEMLRAKYFIDATIERFSRSCELKPGICLLLVWGLDLPWNFFWAGVTFSLGRWKTSKIAHDYKIFSISRNHPNLQYIINFLISIHVPCFFHYFVLWPKNAQLCRKLSHSYMFRHYPVIFRELVNNTLPSYTSISKAAVGNTFYN
jgi:hypothetical protein